MGKFYIVKDTYFPNTAPTNRMMGFLKEFSEQGIDCEVCFFMSDFSYSEAPEMPHVKYHYYWKSFKTKNRILRQLLYLKYYVYKFARLIKEGDIVLLLSCDELVPLLTKKNGVLVYQERTEHTDFSRNKMLDYNKYFEACKKLSGLFLISNNLKEFYVSKGISPEKIHIINMTVDPSRFDNITKTSTNKCISYCGKASNNKDGVDELLKAFAIVKKNVKDVQLQIIGESLSPSDNSGNLKLIEQLGLTDVVFTGMVNHTEVPRLLVNSTILVLDRPENKQAYYGFPTKLGEYLLSHNPVVVTKVGNIPDFFENGVNIMLAEPSNSQDFAKKIIWLLNNPTKAISIGLSGCKVALDEFNSSTETQKLISIIFNRL